MASTQVLWPLTAAAWLWANSLTGQTSTGSTAADRIAFTRLNTYALEVAEPGLAVVRDSAARWWTPPSIEAALDTGQSALKLLSWRRLTRDSTLPFSDLRRLAVAAAAQVGPGLGLLGNPRVRSSVELLTILRSVPRARELLFRLHAYAVARDQRADTASLEVIIDGLRRGGDHPDLAYLLVRNKSVQEDEPLLRSLHYVVQGDSAACSVP